MRQKLLRKYFLFARYRQAKPDNKILVKKLKLVDNLTHLLIKYC